MQKSTSRDDAMFGVPLDRFVRSTSPRVHVARPLVARNDARVGDEGAPASYAAHRAARARRARLFGVTLRAIARALSSALRRALAARERRRMAKAWVAELAQLDDHMLRDLGLDRSEIGSVVAESMGNAEYTRERVGRTLDQFPGVG